MSQSQARSDMRGGLVAGETPLSTNHRELSSCPPLDNVTPENYDYFRDIRDIGSHEALSSGPPLDNGTPTNYDYLWDICGDHENIEGWPFVSADQIHRYLADRDFSAHTTEGDRWDPSYSDADRKNPFCEINTRCRPCSVGYRSYAIPHSCIYASVPGKRPSLTIVCKGDACTEKFHHKNDFLRHVNTIHDKQRFDCPVSGCGRVGDKGFTRMDNLLDHRRKVHKQKIPRTKVLFGEDRFNLDKDPDDVRVGTFELADEATEAVDGGMVAFRRLQDEF